MTQATWKIKMEIWNEGQIKFSFFAWTNIKLQIEFNEILLLFYLELIINSFS